MLLRFRPPGRVPRAAPTLQNIAFGIKLHNRWGCDAAVGARRGCGRAVLVWLDVSGAADHPNVIVLIRYHHRKSPPGSICAAMVWARMDRLYRQACLSVTFVLALAE